MNAVLKPTAKPGMHPDEWKTRLELAACYRVFAMLGWTEMIYNHITLRLPDSVTGDAAKSSQFLINPFGLHYSEVTASNLLKIDLEGNKLDQSAWPVNPLTRLSLIRTGLPSGVVSTAATNGVLPAAPRPRLPPVRSPPR